jgi:hypothetical protein
LPRNKEEGSCRCPYCHLETPNDSPICQCCGSTLQQGEST